MKKRMLIMLICVGILFGSIFLYKAFNSFMMKIFMTSNPPAVTVSAAKAKYSLWQTEMTASGSLRAIRGVNVTTELSGIVQKIYFKPGDSVQQGTILTQLNIDADVSKLNSLKAAADLADTTFKRDKAQYAVQAISKAALDADAADLKTKQAQVAEQLAIIAKKTIRAPFTGRLGISAINPGQYLNAGDKIVTLQELNPIYMDFYVPQQALPKLKIAQAVDVTIDAFPGKIFSGKITTIEPIVDSNTRNVEIEATVLNLRNELLPGMFARVRVRTGTPQRFLTLPQTAITFNSYGDIVYIVRKSGKDKKGKPLLSVTQSFVTTGETRGDQIMILKGLHEGDTVVTSGQLKLKNGTTIAINNSVTPSNNPTPNTIDE